MQDKDFVAYEYKTKRVAAQDQPQTADMYEAFGWEVTAVTPSAGGGVNVSFRRSRKLAHRQELSRLERQAEQTAAVIAKLRRAKTLGARVFAYIFGAAAALVFGGGMSMALLHADRAAWLAGGCVLGAAGIVLCAVNYFAYRRLAQKKEARLQPAIEDNEDKLADILERGDGILRGGTV